MIGVDKILSVIELMIFSAHIEGEQPVSGLVTAPIEGGKTETVMKFSLNAGCVVLTDATAYGIMRDYGQAIINKEIRHIIIPDLVKPTSRGKDTVQSLIAFFNSLIEEGVYRISTYAEKLGVPPQGIGGIQTQIPVKCGLIATLAKEVLLDGRHHWTRMGFMSRLLPISYDYSVDTQLQIHQSIAKRDYLKDAKINLNLPTGDMPVKLQQSEADYLAMLSQGLASLTNKNNPVRVYGFRLQKHLQRLAMASALKDGRDMVVQKDVDYVRSLCDCINLEYYPL